MVDETPVTSVTPVVESAPVTPTVTPVEAPVVVAETPVAVETPVAPESTSIVGDALAAPEAEKPIEVKPPEGEQLKVEGEPDKPVEENKPEGQSDEPAPPPTYEAFTIPEDVSLEPERLKEFTDILGEFEGKTKADHAFVQEFGQKAVDFHVSEVKKTVETLNRSLAESWENTKTEWKDSFMKDPEIGGNRWQTTVDAASSFIRTHGGTAEQQSEFRKLMDMSGVGNHPAMIRLLASAGRAMSEGRPLAASSPVSPPKSKVATMYGKN